MPGLSDHVGLVNVACCPQSSTSIITLLRNSLLQCPKLTIVVIQITLKKSSSSVDKLRFWMWLQISIVSNAPALHDALSLVHPQYKFATFILEPH